MPRIGLTGGIGAGKSEVSRRLAARGAVVIDADAVAREIVALGTPGLAAIVAEFGSGVLRPDGALDRERLGQIAFGDPAQLAKLNAITHPLIARRIAELERAAAADPAAIVVLDVPLLAEANLATGLDAVIVVDAAPAAQLDRLVRDRGMTREHAADRMAAQASREDRLAIADLVIDNSGSLADLDREVDRVWAELRRLAAGRSA